jgi:hypothetical protein
VDEIMLRLALKEQRLPKKQTAFGIIAPPKRLFALATPLYGRDEECCKAG